MLLHDSRLAGREWVAHETLAIRVERPARFTFRPGQYVDLTIPNLAERDALGPIRSLSMASAPEAQYLEFVMRLRETAFKRALATMPTGARLLLEGPLDDLDFDRDTGRHRAFIAGGVGIAPFLSLLRGALATKSPIRTTLFYSNRRPEDAAYLQELLDLERAIPGFRLIPTMTRVAESRRAWKGETDRLGLGLFERYLPRLDGLLYYIVGAPTLVSELRWDLVSAGVSDTDIAIELYVGY